MSRWDWSGRKHGRILMVKKSYEKPNNMKANVYEVTMEGLLMGRFLPGMSIVDRVSQICDTLRQVYLPQSPCPDIKPTDSELVQTYHILKHISDQYFQGGSTRGVDIQDEDMVREKNVFLLTEISAYIPPMPIDTVPVMFDIIDDRDFMPVGEFEEVDLLYADEKIPGGDLRSVITDLVPFQKERSASDSLIFRGMWGPRAVYVKQFSWENEGLLYEKEVYRYIRSNWSLANERHFIQLLTCIFLPDVNEMAIVTEDSGGISLYEAGNQHLLNKPEDQFSILLQLLYVIYLMRQMDIVHNDLHAGNIIIVWTKTHTFECNMYDRTYYAPDSSFFVKIYDFDRANILSKEQNNFLNESGLCRDYGQCTNPDKDVFDWFLIAYDLIGHTLKWKTSVLPRLQTSEGYDALDQMLQRILQGRQGFCDPSLPAYECGPLTLPVLNHRDMLRALTGEEEVLRLY